MSSKIVFFYRFYHSPVPFLVSFNYSEKIGNIESLWKCLLTSVISPGSPFWPYEDTESKKQGKIK